MELETQHRELVQLQHFLADVRQNEEWERRKHLSAGFRLAKRIMLEQQGEISPQGQFLRIVIFCLHSYFSATESDLGCLLNVSIYNHLNFTFIKSLEVYLD
mgnify:CR=1 FL=1